MKKLSKFIIALMAVVAIFATVGSTGLAVSAAEPDPEPMTDDQIKEQLAEELKFYFETVGHVNEDGTYVVDDEEHFVQAFSEDADVDQKVLDTYYSEKSGGVSTAALSPRDYALCIVVNSVPFGGVAWELATAVTAEQGFIDAITSLNYSLASDIIVRVGREVLTDAAFKQLTQLNLATSIVSAIWTCSWE